MVLFVLRRHNDIDHMVPIIYKMAEKGVNALSVLSMDPLHNIERDCRLRYLKDKWGIESVSIYKAYTPTIFHSLIAYMIYMPKISKNGVKKGGRSYFKCLLQRIYIRFFHEYIYSKIGRKYFFNRHWALGLLKKKKVRVAVFDYTKKDQFVTGALIDAAGSRNIPTVAIPHGLKIWPDRYIKEDDWFDTELEEKAPYTRCVVSNRWSFNLYHHDGGGWRKEKLKIIGSARYCSEWVRKCYEIFKPFEGLKGETSKLKIVFFEGGSRFLKSQTLVTEAIKEISEMENVRLIVQPRPRNPALPLESVNSSVYIDFESSAFNLCRWADVVITGITSVFIEPLVQKKVLIFPAYWHTRISLLEEEGVGYSVNSLNELKQALSKMQTSPGSLYPEENVQNFLTEIVYGGDKERNVLSEYCKFIFSVADHSSIKGNPA